MNNLSGGYSNKVVQAKTLEQKRNVEGTVVPRYTFGSVFPNKEIRDAVLEEIDRSNKKIICELLGVFYEDIDEISWDYLEELDVQRKQEKTPKSFLKKIRGKGV